MGYSSASAVLLLLWRSFDSPRDLNLCVLRDCGVLRNGDTEFFTLNGVGIGWDFRVDTWIKQWS